MVNLFGYESAPTREDEKKTRLEGEQSLIDETKNEILRWTEKDITSVLDLSIPKKQFLGKKIN